MSGYNRFPKTELHDCAGHVWTGYDSIIDQLRSSIKEDCVLAVETYPGVFDDEIIPEIQKLEPDLFINTMDLFPSESELTDRMRPFLTDDRVFGRMCYGEIRDFMNTDRIIQAQEKIQEAAGLVIVYGFGASQICSYDRLVYLDLARWQIQLRYRAGMSNYHCHNSSEDILRKYKRGFFLEWRIADKQKQRLLGHIDYLIDTNEIDHPKMIDGELLNRGLKQTVSGPIRLVPYFDPGVWGGQWMKKVCNLDPEKKNYAWSFDGVPEENSILLACDNTVIELPAMDAVLAYPTQLLGPDVYARFGAEFPIRFDFLDTIQGQNLSLQVHPTAEYIHRQFGMAYTQDESYYILDADPGAAVYLGLKEGVNSEEMLSALRASEKKGGTFDAEKYINRFPAAKHDHFLIPAGTIHCSGAGAMVLEISATPYIFTFKLWDWGRLGMDGKPRPINVEHGSHVIQWDRTTPWVKKNLVSPTVKLHEEDAYTEEHTGLHELEFIETRRYWIRSEVHLDTENTVSIANLVEGDEALISSDEGKFEPFTVHYAETVILPADIGRFTIQAVGKPIGVIRAYVRKPK